MRKPNYRFERADRDRAKKARNDKKLQRQERAVTRVDDGAPEPTRRASPARKLAIPTLRPLVPDPEPIYSRSITAPTAGGPFWSRSPTVKMLGARRLILWVRGRGSNSSLGAADLS